MTNKKHCCVNISLMVRIVERRKHQGSSNAFKKDLQPQVYVTPQQIKSLFLPWTRKKASAPPKLSSVSVDTYEDVMSGMKIILCSIYYCIMWKYFCLNELIYFVCISIYMLQNKGIFILKIGCKI